ncbi:MAG: cysteine--tRNA ligase [Alphaproteobacteria bacterium]
MSLFLYNTFAAQKEIFVPIDINNVRLYVCGPTVYDRIHIGNARPIVVFDVLYRLLSRMYKKVTYVRNITDIDDKIYKRSQERNISVSELTKETIKYFKGDTASLNVFPPDYEPIATEHIKEMISMIKILIDKGFAYQNEGHVLFEVKKFKNYGKLSKCFEKKEGARIEPASYKKDPYDFVLWKPSIGDWPGWDSPFGYGRPGWHIECSAMSAFYLGETFDIHGGGVDLVFPHHENEIAQTCSALGTSFMAKVWMHNGHITVKNSKMSKSTGNIIMLYDLLAEHPGEVIRLALLMTHYRKPIDWDDRILVQAKKTLDRFYKVLLSLDGHDEFEKDNKIDFDKNVMDALFDDLNTPLAIHHLYELSNSFFKTNEMNEKVKIAQKLKASANILGILNSSPYVWFKKSVDEREIRLLIEKRETARKQKDFKTADKIRGDLEKQGIILEDTKDGPTWRSVYGQLI